MDLQRPLNWVFHYANAAPTESTWRRITLGPIEKLILPAGVEPPAAPTFGIASLEQLEIELAQYRDFLSRWVNLESVYSEDAAHLVREINERAALIFDGWALSVESEQLFERWATKTDSFREMLYSYLAVALKEVSFRSIHRCEACAKFFFEPSKRDWKFCSLACRNRVMSQRYRERQGGGGAQRTTRSQPRKRPPRKKG